jgi:2-dehydropantoate 2-reductase
MVMSNEKAIGRIVVIGAGAVGSALGALLHRMGRDVVLIARPEHVAAIRQNGLQVDGVAGSFVARLAAAEALDYRPDLALLTVKAQDVASAVKANQAFLNDVPIVTFQNGVRSDEAVAEILPRDEIISAVVTMNAAYLEPGKVTVAIQGNLVIGRPFIPRDPKLEEVAQILNQAIPTRITDNIQGVHWMKLIINLNNALPALTGYSMKQVYADGYLSRLAVGIMREGQRAIRRATIRLEPLPEVSVALNRFLSFIPLGIAARIVAGKYQRVMSEWPLWSSTLQSIRRHRPAEIDYLNGEIVELGRRCGEATPLNTKIVELVHQVEQTGQFLSAEQIREAFSELRIS